MSRKYWIAGIIVILLMLLVFLITRKDRFLPKVKFTDQEAKTGEVLGPDPCEKLFIYDYISKAEIKTTNKALHPGFENWGFSAKITKAAIVNTKEGTIYSYNFKNQVIEESLFALQDSSGKVLKLYRNLPLKSENLSKFAIFMTQYVVNQSIRNDEWGGVEPDVAGQVQVKYLAESESRIKKQRIAYIEYFNPLQMSEIKESEFGFIFSDKILQQVTGYEKLILHLPIQGVFETDYSISLKLLSAGGVPDEIKRSCRTMSMAEGVKKWELVEIPFFYREDEQKTRLAEKEQIKGTEWKDLLSLIKDKDLDQKKKQEALNKLVMFLNVYPEKLEELFLEIKTNSDDREYAALLIAAISSSTSEKAQDTLIRIMETFSDDSFILEQTIQSHHNSPHPSAKNADFLLKIFKENDSPDVRVKAILAVGTVLRRLGSEEERAKGTELLIREFNSQDEEQSDKRDLIIEALGNAGQIEALPLLKKIANDPKNPLAEKAIEAMRFVPGQEVEGELLTLLNGTNVERKRASLYALYHHLPLSQSAINIIINDYVTYGFSEKNMETEKLALDILSLPLYREKPEVIGFFRQLLSDPKVTSFEKKQIEKILEPGDKEGSENIDSQM